MSKLKRFLISCLILTALIPQLTAQVDFREETIYFLITTRFFDGDPSNNVPNEWCSYNGGKNEITDPNDVTWRGDFKGLIEKLDYIQNLGFTAIWITPVVQNWSPLDYHGYHAYDFTKVDPRLESPGATFQDLIDEVHKRDMKIVLDIVTNHSGRFGIKGKAEIKYNTDPSQVWGQDKGGETLKPNPDWEYDGITPNPDDGKIWSRANIPPMPAPYNQNLANYNWPSTESYVNTTDPNWYHHSGNGFAQGWDDTENLYNRALAGDCPDLNTASSYVRDYLIKAYKKYIQMGVDALRWDTMKHMSKEDILAFYDEFKKINPELFIFGEVAQKRHELHQVEEINPHWYTWRGAVNASEPSGIAVLDFYAEASFHNPFEDGGNFSQVKSAARYDHLYADPSTNLLWLDNHDFGPNNDWNRRFGGSAENLAACMNFMFTWRGIPVVYYGTEMQFMKGAFADIHESSDINRSLNLTGRAYYGDVMDQASGHKIHGQIKKLNAIRSAVPALQKGSWEWNGTNDGNGVGFVRRYGSSEVAVGLAKDGSVTFNFTGLTNGTYRDAVTGDTKEVTSGSLSTTVSPSSAAIYVLNGPGIIGECGAGFFQSDGECISKPVVTIFPADEHSETSIEVSMKASEGEGAPFTIFYTTDGSEPHSGSSTYETPFTITKNTIVKAKAKDKAGKWSNTVTKKYVIGELPGHTVHFKNTDNWGEVYIYLFDKNGNQALPGWNWSGVPMTKEGNTQWYKYNIDESVEVGIVINNNNNGQQTDDLFRNKEGWYDFRTKKWHDQCPGDCPGGDKPVLNVNPASTDFKKSIEVDLSATNNGKIYYTTDGSEPDDSDKLYSGQLEFTVTTALNAIAYNEFGSSHIIKETYTQKNEEPPVLSVSPKGGAYSSPFSVSLSVTNGGEIYYTLDGSTPTKSSERYTGSFNWGSGRYILKAIAYNSAGESNIIEEEYLVEDNDCYTVYFKNSCNWTSPKIYLWDKNTNRTIGASWPGTVMSGIGGTDWFSYEICEEVELGIIFNGSGSQTDDLSRNYTGWYDCATKQWYDECPSGCPGGTEEGLTVYYNNNTTNWSSVSLYFWNATPSGPTISWPGVQMTDSDGDGWFEYTLQGVECSNVIFSNDGSSQTADLHICHEGYYDNGWVEKPEGLKSIKGISNVLNQERDIIQHPYPNPFRNALKFTLNKVDLKSKVVISDAKGMVVYNKEIFSSDGSFELDIEVPKGIYFMQVAVRDTVYNFPLVKN